MAFGALRPDPFSSAACPVPIFEVQWAPAVDVCIPEDSAALGARTLGASVALPVPTIAVQWGDAGTPLAALGAPPERCPVPIAADQ
jgi:hypothetical protein